MASRDSSLAFQGGGELSRVEGRIGEGIRVGGDGRWTEKHDMLFSSLCWQIRWFRFGSPIAGSVPDSWEGDEHGEDFRQFPGAGCSGCHSEADIPSGATAFRIGAVTA